ncbi:MAG: LEA type 2 family protein [Congregibacter sp.]
MFALPNRLLHIRGTLLAAIGTLLLLGLSGCAAVGMSDFDEPQVELVGLTPIAGSGMEARFLVSLRIVNPNSIALDVDGMAYDVFIRGNKVLNGVSNEPLLVDAYSEKTAELEVSVGMFSSFALLRDLLSNPPDGGLPYKLNAKISRRGLIGAIRVTREGTINLENALRGNATM